MNTIELSYRRATIPLVVGILLSLLFARLVWGWTNPTQAPPNGNLSLPSAQWTASGTAIYNSNSGNVGIGITGPGQKLSVAGTIESTSGGFKFPDGTSQTSTAKESGTWSDVTGSRALGTVYQNTSGKKRRGIVSVNGSLSANHTIEIQVGSADPPTLTIARAGNNTNATADKLSVSFEVPSNHYYKAVGSGVALEIWAELDE